METVRNSARAPALVGLAVHGAYKCCWGEGDEWDSGHLPEATRSGVKARQVPLHLVS